MAQVVAAIGAEISQASSRISGDSKCMGYVLPSAGTSRDGLAGHFTVQRASHIAKSHCHVGNVSLWSQVAVLHKVTTTNRVTLPHCHTSSTGAALDPR